MKKFLIFVIILLMVGCASISFNPDTGEVRYIRIGDQHIQGFEVERMSNGSVKVKMSSQQSEAQALTEAIRIIGVLAVPK